MFYKRPSLRRGGTPTGIDSLTPRVRANSGFGFLNFGTTTGDNTGYQEYLKKMRERKESGEPSGIAKLILGERFTNPNFQSPFLNPKGSFFQTNTGFEFLNPSGTIAENINLTTSASKGINEGVGVNDQSATSDDIAELDEGDSLSGGEVNIDKIVKNVVSDRKVDLDELTKKSKEQEITEEAELLDRLTGSGISKGEAALILAKGIGTAGTIADKASVVSDELLKVATEKRKDKKKNVLRAYENYKTKEAAQSKLNNTEKSVQAFVNAKLKDPNNKKTKTQLELEAWNQILGPQGDDKKYYQAYLTTNRFEIDNARTVVKKLEGKTNLSQRDKEKLQKAKQVLKIAETAAELGGVSVYATGGRVNLQQGTPNPQNTIEATEVIEESQSVPLKPVEKLSFSELRNRLPKEITDDIVQLLANSQEALSDFAYIRTTNDVGAFNSKYGVNLILPPNTI